MDEPLTEEDRRAGGLPSAELEGFVPAEAGAWPFTRG